MFNSKKHFSFLEKVFEEGNPVMLSAADSHYPWIGPVENNRLEIQNESGRHNWRALHERFFRDLEKRGFRPRRIAVMGTGKDAAFIPHAFIFPTVKEVCVIELDSEKISGAREVLKRLGLLERVTFSQGNVVDVLPGLGKFDLIDAVLFEQHQPINPPAGLPEKERLAFPTFQKALEARINALNPGGLLVTADFSVQQWGIEAVSKFMDVPEVKKMVEEGWLFIHGEKERKIPGLIDLGWRARGASPWESAEDIAETMLKFSDGKLELLRELNAQCFIDYRKPGNRIRMNVMVGYIIAAIALMARASLAANENKLKAQPDSTLLQETVNRLRHAVDFLFKEGEKNIKILKDPRIAAIFPPVEFLAFKKV